MIKSDGRLLGFVERPIAAGLGTVTILVWLSPLILHMIRARRAGRA